MPWWARQTYGETTGEGWAAVPMLCLEFLSCAGPWLGAVIATVFSSPSSQLSRATGLILHLQGGKPAIWSIVTLLGTFVLVAVSFLAKADVPGQA